MKIGFIAVVVLSLTAHSPAYGDPSPGVQCVLDCIPSSPPDTGGSSRCTDFIKLTHCVEECPADKYVTLARESRLIVEKHCADAATTEKFFADTKRFQEAWSSEQDKCLKSGSTPEEACKEVTDCIFGSALTSARSGFSEDVVSANVNSAKLSIGSTLESSGEALPNSCDQLLEPYHPEPYPPEPPYPYEPYPYEPYEPESYQRNPYQRTPYQQNPYHRNPYRRYPHQRNTYQRNPY